MKPQKTPNEITKNLYYQGSSAITLGKWLGKIHDIPSIVKKFYNGQTREYSIDVTPNESGGLWGECQELSGCFSQGESVEELAKNMREAIALCIGSTDDGRSSEKGEIVVNLHINHGGEYGSFSLS
ncbi:MAG: type II toxin-antitoxin system HicB family antitoxin [Synergistaceae bacterium]|jgi:predicted RNase H-like HicB family nuclease|nr:type II toxin-antitoxin system HicB family antitoxin [Synergistaceae bacterium]